MYPCPCGYFGDSQKPCTCYPSTVTKYQKRISGHYLTVLIFTSRPQELITKSSAKTARAKFLNPFTNESRPHAIYKINVSQKRID
ncbi:MAG: ATP-binding protein [Chloroflexi bacterium]|nr:ATP-binding protein [Chloroflexota bacterium]